MEMAPPVIVIRRSTDERRAQPRVASKRVRGLPGAMCAGYFHGSAGSSPRVASKRVRGSRELCTRGIFVAEHPGARSDTIPDNGAPARLRGRFLDVALAMMRGSTCRIAAVVAIGVVRIIRAAYAAC